MRLTRRAALASLAWALPKRAGAQTDLDALEAQLGGRLGVAAIGGGVRLMRRPDERFPLCSTHKALSAAAILARVDRGEERLDRRVRFGAEIVLPYSPVTQAQAGGPGMTVGALCEAAVTLSDNTAGNLLLDALGGPAGWTESVRGFGDVVTRLDRREPDLNAATPGDPRDTTTPLAMATTLSGLVLGETLSPPSRAQLTAWLVGCRTGDTKLRAGMPGGWRVGDKSGAGERGTICDVGVLWPAQGTPIVIAVYVTGSAAPASANDAAIANVARMVAAQSST